MSMGPYVHGSITSNFEWGTELKRNIVKLHVHVHVHFVKFSHASQSLCDFVTEKQT